MPGETLTVATFNIYHQPEDRAAFDSRALSIAGAIAAVRPDVICLQEAPDTDFARALTAFLSRQQKRDFRLATTELIRPDGWREHLGIIHLGTRRAARRVEGSGGTRIALSVDLQKPAITIFCTHLDPWSAELRHEQATAITAALPPLGPLVLAGDLNATPSGGTLRALCEAGLDRIAPPGEAITFPTALRHLPDRPRAALDHILTRGLEVIETGLGGEPSEGGAWPSDHMLVWARLQVA